MSSVGATGTFIVLLGTGMAVGTGYILTLLDEPYERTDWRSLRRPDKWIADLRDIKTRLPKEPTPKPEPLRVAILNRMTGVRHSSSLNHSVMRRARSGLPARYRYYQGSF